MFQSATKHEGTSAPFFDIIPNVCLFSDIVFLGRCHFHREHRGLEVCKVLLLFLLLLLFWRHFVKNVCIQVHKHFTYIDGSF